MLKKGNFSWFFVALIIAFNVIIFSSVIKNLKEYFEVLASERAGAHVGGETEITG